MPIAVELNSRMPGRNNRDRARARAFTLSVRPVVKYTVFLVLGVWLVYQLRRSYFEWWHIDGGISKSQFNKEQSPKAAVQDGSAGLSNSNKTATNVTNPVKNIDFFLRQDEEDYQRRKKEIEEFQEKSQRGEFEYYQEKYQRGEKQLIKKETFVENVSNTPLHGKDDGVNKIEEKGVMTKMEGSIQTESDQSKWTDGVYRFSDENGILQHVCVNKIDEKGAPTKMKASIQTEPDQSKLNDGVYSFSGEKRIRQHFHVSKVEEKGALTKIDEIFPPEHGQMKLNEVNKKEEKGAPDKHLEMSLVDDIVNLVMLMEHVNNECSKLVQRLNQLWAFVEGTEEFRTTVFAVISLDPLLKTLDPLLKSSSKLISEYADVSYLESLIRLARESQQKVRAGLDKIGPALEEPFTYMRVMKQAENVEQQIKMFEQMFLMIGKSKKFLMRQITEKAAQNTSVSGHRQPEEQHSEL